MQDIKFSEQLVSNYMSLKNGDRDLSKLTPEEFLHCRILEAEFLTTAVLLLYQVISEGKCAHLNFTQSPLRIIDALDGEQVAKMCEVFAQSEIRQANEIIREMNDVTE
jgi:hypothetical protein